MDTLLKIWVDFQIWHSTNFIYSQKNPDALPLDQILTIAIAIIFAAIALFQNKYYWRYSKSIRITSSILATSYLISSVFYNWLFTAWVEKKISNNAALDFNFTFVTLDAAVIFFCIIIHLKTRTIISSSSKGLLFCTVISSILSITHELLLHFEMYWVKNPFPSEHEYIPLFFFTLISYLYYMLNGTMMYFMLRRKA